MQRLNVVNFKAGTAAVGAAIAVTSQNVQAHKRPRLAVNRFVKLKQRYNSIPAPVLPLPSQTLLRPA